MRPATRVLLWIVLSAGFTLIIVQWSLRHGRLILPPTYDDVGYLTDGLSRLEVLYRDRLPGLLAEHFRHPPHSPFSSYLALAGFALFGAHDWAPYASNVIIVLALLAFVDYLLRERAWWVRLAGYVLALTVPVTGEAVAEFRPDIACGLVTAMGVVLLLERPFFTIPPAQRRWAGVCFGLALLFKPTAFSLTLALFGLSLVVATLSDRARLPATSPAKGVARSWAPVFWPAALLGLPQFVITGRYYFDYFRWNIVGSSHPWRFKATVVDQLTYYLSGEGGRIQLGLHLYLLSAIVLIGAVWMARHRSDSLRSLRNQLVLLAVAYAVPALNPVKQIFFGVTFAFLLTFLAVQVLASLITGSESRGGVWRPAAILAGVLLVGILCAQSPASWGNPSDPDVQGRNRLAQDVHQELRELSTKRNPRVFLTSPGRINPELLQLMALKDGLGARFHQQCSPGVSCIYLSDDMKRYLPELESADFVLVGESGNSETFTNLPGGRIQEQLLAVVRARPDYVERAAFPTLTGKPYFIFERIGPFFGWSAMEGFLDEEGPYPQWELPVVRWGRGPVSRLAVEDQRGGRRRLVSRCRSDFKGQVMTIRLDGTEIGRHAFMETGRFDQIEIPLVLAPGAHSVELDYAVSDSSPTGLNRAVLFEVLRLVPEGRGQRE